jgi:hypothetical protein
MPGWDNFIADLSKFYSWGPYEAWGLPLSELAWWHQQMDRMINGE